MEYISVEDIRDEGVKEEEAEDPRVENLIETAEQYFENMTGQHFYEKETTMTLYGRDSKTIFLPVHIISCDKIEINEETINSDKYRIFNRYMPDDRHNPKIVFDFEVAEGDTVDIEGSFGFVEEDGSTPKMVEYAIKKLVINEIPLMTDSEGQDEKKRGRIIREKSDKYEYELSDVMVRNDLTGDPDIDRVILQYQAPIGGGVV